MMLTTIVDVGSFKAINIPDKVISSMFPNGLAQINIRQNFIEIVPVANNRENWDIRFKSQDSGNNSPIYSPNTFDEEEWEW